jgi:glycosyltransferase involved in cell wall biosynthesis/phosphoheptose isomerase
MRIAMVSEHASPLAALGGADAGGQNVHVAALASAIARRGAEVIVYTRRDSPDLPRQVQMQPGVTVQHLNAGPAKSIPKDEIFAHLGAFTRELERAWRRLRPDIVHAHFWMSGHASLSAAGALGVPVVQTFHALGVVKRRYQGQKDTSPPERCAVEREILGSVDHVIATCTDEVFELLRIGGSSDQLTVVPCGVDLSLFAPDGPRDECRPGMRRLVAIGRLVERKGFGNAISALADLPRTELVVAGGPERSRLRRDPEARRLLRLAEEAGVADRVELRGRLAREEVPPLIRSADAVVSVPWYEPFGIVPLEAMACGVPAIAAAVGGMIDTVVDEVTGVHVPPRDPERLAQAANALLDDPERRARLGRAGVERVRRLYDWNRIAASTLDVYARVTRGQRPSRRLRSGFELPPTGREHLDALRGSLAALDREADRISRWGERLAVRLAAGGRLLAIGNGGSAAQAQHLTAELVGRYQTERGGLSAICLHADTSSLTAIANDYGFEEAYARQVRAHGREDDVLIALSTSGRSRNVVAAVEAAAEAGLATWAILGRAPNPLAEVCDEAICLPGPTAATVQELHLVALHMLCAAVDRELALGSGARGRAEALA